MRPRRFVLTMTGVGLALGTAAVLAPAANASDMRIDRVPRALHVSAATRAPDTNSPNWKIVYTDQFNAPLNPAVWSVYDRDGSSNPGTAGYSPSHVTVSDGQLHIKGYVDRSVKPDGRVVTGGLGMWQRPQLYGRYTMLVRMDACTDVKYAWMLWPYNNNWPADGEIDFAEDEGGDRALTTASLNWAGSQGQFQTAQTYAEPRTPLSGWHVLGVDWTPTSVRYRLDGQYWGAAQTQHIPHTPMVFVLQTEGKAWPGHVTLRGQCNADIGWVVQYAYVGKR